MMHGQQNYPNKSTYCNVNKVSVFVKVIIMTKSELWRLKWYCMWWNQILIDATNCEHLRNNISVEFLTTKTTPKRSTYEENTTLVFCFRVIWMRFQWHIILPLQSVAFVMFNRPNEKHLLKSDSDQCSRWFDIKDLQLFMAYEFPRGVFHHLL